MKFRKADFSLLDVDFLSEAGILGVVVSNLQLPK